VLQEYEGLIRSVLKNVPSNLRDDCYQAACVGLLQAFQKKDSIRNFRSYAWSCMYHEVLTVVAQLKYPISLDKVTFMMLCKYKTAKSNKTAVDKKLAKSRIRSLDKLYNLQRVPYQVVE
jgi:DNA-directed RNA polymerase specialized sigma subunit